MAGLAINPCCTTHPSLHSHNGCIVLGPEAQLPYALANNMAMGSYHNLHSDGAINQCLWRTLLSSKEICSAFGPNGPEEKIEKEHWWCLGWAQPFIIYVYVYRL